MPIPRFSVDDALERVVRRVGGELVADLLPQNANLQKNADYVFREHNVIGELKRLEKDQDEDQQFRQKRNDMALRWMNEGKIPPVYGGRFTLGKRRTMSA
jgi:hypothetical protein